MPSTDVPDIRPMKQVCTRAVALSGYSPSCDARATVWATASWALTPSASWANCAFAAGGMTMVIATHEMGFARDIASRVCFLDGGVILEQGSPEQMFESPRQGRTQQFLQRIVSARRL